MTQNTKLNKAFKEKDDEFYTQIKDIELELANYKNAFNKKKILCNCDDYKKSNFVRYFAENFDKLGIDSITAISYNNAKNTNVVKIKRNIENYDIAVQNNDKRLKCKQVAHNGDFRNKESIELLKKSDIVVTNPPFSLFRAFIDILINYNKKFLIIGNCNAISYKNCFSYIVKNKMWIGNNCIRWFKRPNGLLSEAARSYWFTNLKTDKERNFYLLETKYQPDIHLEYDNYIAIEVSKVKNIPMDYLGVMGVPLTFLEKYNPAQFEILGMDFYVKDGNLDLAKKSWNGKLDRAYLNGKRMYSRILIQQKQIMN